MRDIESLLREASLTAPSPRLRARVGEALAHAEERSARWFRFPVPLWACGLAAIACGALGFWAHTALTPPPPQIVYILPAEGELHRLLNGETEAQREDDARRWRVTVTTPAGEEL